MVEIDDLDSRLISLLRANGRESVVQLAQKLGVTRTTVDKRLRRLLDEGIITGFSAQVRSSTQDTGIRAITLFAIEGRSAGDVIRGLRGVPEIIALHTTNGQWDLVAEVICDSIAGLDRMLGAVRAIDGIRNTETVILLSTAKK